jgi:hypothetical protein
MLTLTEEQLAAIKLRISQSSRKVNGKYGLNVPENAPQAPPARQKAQPKGSGRKRPVKRPLARESQVMEAVAGILERHPLVAAYWRQNTGAAKLDNRFIKFSFRGCSDYLGFLTDGRILAVECKATGKKPTAEQAAFLASVEKVGGFACCTDSGLEVFEKLEQWRKSK